MTNAAITLLKLDNVHWGFLDNVVLQAAGDPVGSRALHAINAYQNYIYRSLFYSTEKGADLDGTCNDFDIIDTSIGVSGICLRIKDTHNVNVRGGQYSDAAVGIQVLRTTPLIDVDGIHISGGIHFEGNTRDVEIGPSPDTVGQVVFAATGVTFPNLCYFNRAEFPTLTGCYLRAGYTTTSNTNYLSLLSTRVEGTVTEGSTTTFRIEDGSVKLANGAPLRMKNPGGTSRRIALLSAAGTIYYGDVDNAMNAALLLGAGGTQPLLFYTNNVERGRFDQTGLFTLAGNLQFTPANAVIFGQSNVIVRIDSDNNETGNSFVVQKDGGAQVFRLADDGKLWIGTTEDTNLYRNAANVLKTDDALVVSDALTVKTKAGVPADGDFLQTPPDGTVAADTTNSRWYVRIGGVWKSLTLDEPGIQPAFQAGKWYGQQFGSASTAALVDGTAYAVPFFVGRTGASADRIACEVTVAGAASSVIRMGIYSSDSDRRPGALLLEAGTVTADSTGFKTITIAQALPYGLIWLVAVPQGGAPTVGIQAGHSPYVGHPNPSGTGGNLAAYMQTGVTGALPNPFVAGNPNFGVRTLLRAA